GGSTLAGAPTCTVDGSAATVSGSGPYTVSVLGNGTHPVVCSVSDNAGNTGSGSDSVKIDTANPTVTVSHTVNGTNGWNTNSPVTVNVTTADTGTSGLAGAPTCTVDGSAATVSGSGPYSVAVSGNGTHPVVCTVSDNAGNSGNGNDSVKIDTLNPSGSITINSDATYTNSVSATLNLLATDATSKIVSYRVAEASDCSSATFGT